MIRIIGLEHDYLRYSAVGGRRPRQAGQDHG